VRRDSFGCACRGDNVDYDEGVGIGIGDGQEEAGDDQGGFEFRFGGECQEEECGDCGEEDDAGECA